MKETQCKKHALQFSLTQTGKYAKIFYVLEIYRLINESM